MTHRAVRSIAVVIILLFAAAGQGFAQESRYIVKFRTGRHASGQSVLRAAGAQIVLTLGPQNAVAARIPAAALEGLSRNPNIEYIEPDAVREPSALSDVPSGSGTEILPYGVQMVQANLVSSPAASNVRLCIIDSGYSTTQEDLRNATGADLSAKESDSGSGTWNKDSCGHGTHVAGTASATAGNRVGVVGVNPDVSLHIVKVFGNDTLVEDGSCGWTYSSNLVNALNSCVAAGSKVVSMSLVGGVRSRTEEAAFADANANGVLSIAAAGNAGNGSTGYPAGYASVMSVAAVDANEVAAAFSQQNRDVEIAAPGVGVLSTVPWLDASTLTVGRTTWFGSLLEGAPRTPGVTGNLVDGGRCTDAGAWAGLVVLCQRGDIDFAVKVKNVQAGGGVAAVIYNNAASDPSCGVFSGTLGRRVTTTIPAIALSCADGAAALGHVGSSGEVESSFTAPASGYESWNGTSMATPHVSAVAALIWSCHPGATNQQVRDALNATAKDKGAAGRDTVYGWGIVQAKAALLALGGAAGAGLCTVF